jgi:hypothetical protein
MTPVREPPEYFVEVNLGPTALRVLPVLPVDDQQLQLPPPDRLVSSSALRIRASSTPLMNRGLSPAPYFSAS